MYLILEILLYLPSSVLKNRSRVDIIANILRNAHGGASRFHIMSLAFISHKQLLEYLAMLQRNDLIEVDAKTTHIYTTRKGENWITVFNKLMELSSDIFDEEIKHRLSLADRK